MSLTQQSILAMRDRLLEVVGPVPPPMRFFKTDAAVVSKWRKVYPKHKAKNASHHRRMNNKWRKRYGMVMVPTMLTMNDPVTGTKMILVHPSQWHLIADLPRDAFGGPPIYERLAIEQQGSSPQ